MVRRLLLVLCLAWTTMGAPQYMEFGADRLAAAAGRASDLPMEHRQGQNGHPVDKFVDRVLSSETASALDSAAARIATVFGDIVDDIGDFVVSSVDDLPETIDRVSQRVNDAVSQNGEKVVIIVKGVRNRVSSARNETAEVAHNTVSKVGNALETSEVLPSLVTLGERLGSTLERIVDSIASNFGDIDKAVAGGIRVSHPSNSDTVVNGQQQSAAQLNYQPTKYQYTAFNKKVPNESQNELRSY
ncbi:unnamed protein product [Meganyctiphanes norvegica]|uniref:Uncharacterized protein n=1 Tax=Meganyctiphanes norvegica TaxID=48144 RepID=A0AAV2SA17_MEGNR